MNLKGIDISKWQGTIDFNDLKSHFDFVIMKTSEGNGYVDTQFLNNQAGSRSVDMLRGYYHFARPDLKNTPEAEANWFLKTIGKIQDGEMLCLDYEPSWNGDAVTWCKGFLDRIYFVTGCRPLIYLNQSLVKNNNWKTIIDNNYGLWLAVYDYNPDTAPPSTPWPTVAIKQFSNKYPYGTLQVDANIFYGDATTFKKYGYTINSSEPDMTENEERILSFVRENNITEGQVRQGYGYIIDKIDEKIKGLEADNISLNARVLDLENKISNYIIQLDADKATITGLNAQVIDLEQKLEVALSDHPLENASISILISLLFKKLFKGNKAS